MVTQSISRLGATENTVGRYVHDLEFKDRTGLRIMPISAHGLQLVLVRTPKMLVLFYIKKVTT